MIAFRLLNFMYALKMEVLYKMNSEQNKMVAVNAARWFCTHCWKHSIGLLLFKSIRGNNLYRLL